MKDLHTNLTPTVGFRQTRSYWTTSRRQPLRKVADPLSATPRDTRRLSTEAEATVWQIYLAYKDTFKTIFKLK